MALANRLRGEEKGITSSMVAVGDAAHFRSYDMYFWGIFR
jgi:hypothetical protein